MSRSTTSGRGTPGLAAAGARAPAVEQDAHLRLGLHALGIGTGAERATIDAVAVAAERSGSATLCISIVW